MHRQRLYIRRKSTHAQFCFPQLSQINFELNQPATSDGVPWCYYPENYGYSLEGIFEIENGIGANLVRNSAIGSMFGSDFEKLILEAEFQTDDRLRIRITLAFWVFARGPYIKDVRTEGGGRVGPKADIVREVAWIYSYRSSQNGDKGGRGSKIPKILRMSFMYGP